MVDFGLNLQRASLSSNVSFFGSKGVVESFTCFEKKERKRKKERERERERENK
jgi:hypothetical protein